MRTLTLALVLAAAGAARAQRSEPLLAHAAPRDQYLMERNAEIALARSAAPPSISRNADVLVLGSRGYETAVKGTNGFACVVERSWMLPFDDPEFLHTKVRLPLCLNPPAARSHLPLTIRATALAFAGLSKQQMFDSLETAYDTKALPLPDPGSMCYMLSKQQYFGRAHGNADPHVMFWFPEKDHMEWGAGLPGSPVYIHQDSPDPITTFVISVSSWSDGTAAPTEAP